MLAASYGDQQEKTSCVHPCSTLSINSRGRERELHSDGIRSAFQRDAHRIAYSQPFRRLRHKTQVFYLPNSDHICTRLEHSIHVANIARTVARTLGLNENLAEAIGLGHDLGHAPFGHHGEKILAGICRKHGLSEAFDHEVNGLRVVDRLGQLDREEPAGLNLTWEVRDGIISHNGEDLSQGTVIPFAGEKKLEAIRHRKEARHPATLEGCIVRIVDKVAYAGRDLEDAIQAGIIEPGDVPRRITSTLGRNNGEITHKLVEDVITTSRKYHDRIGLSEELADALKELIQEFNYKQIYDTDQAHKYEEQARFAMETLFSIFVDKLQETECLRNPAKLSKLQSLSVFRIFAKFVDDIKYPEDEKNEQIAVDFLSGFTDNFVGQAINEILIPKSTDCPGASYSPSLLM